MNNNRALVVGIVVVLVVLAGTLYWASGIRSGGSGGGEVACTLEAKLCPDGSAVGRTGPKCEFAPCPTVNPGDTTSGVRVSGQVTLGPTCPVERIPPDPKCADRAYETSVSATGMSAGAITKSTRSGADGDYSLVLMPGTYELSASGGAVLPRCASQTIKVESGKPLVVNISCDSGIR